MSYGMHLPARPMTSSVILLRPRMTLILAGSPLAESSVAHTSRSCIVTLSEVVDFER